MEKDIFNINSDSLRKLGTDPDEAVKYILNKKAIDLKPVYVRGLQILKEQPTVASS